MAQIFKGFPSVVFGVVEAGPAHKDVRLALCLTCVDNGLHCPQGHMGVKKTMSGLGSMFFPRMKAQVQRYIRGCLECNRAKGDNGKKQGELMPLPIPARPWTDVSLDIVSGFPLVRGKNAILTVVDRRTKTVRAIPIATTPVRSGA